MWKGEIKERNNYSLFHSLLWGFGLNWGLSWENNVSSLGIWHFWEIMPHLFLHMHLRTSNLRKWMLSIPWGRCSQCSPHGPNNCLPGKHTCVSLLEGLCWCLVGQKCKEILSPVKRPKQNTNSYWCVNSPALLSLSGDNFHPRMCPRAGSQGPLAGLIFSYPQCELAW